MFFGNQYSAQSGETSISELRTKIQYPRGFLDALKNKKISELKLAQQSLEAAIRSNYRVKFQEEGILHQMILCHKKLAAIDCLCRLLDILNSQAVNVVESKGVIASCQNLLGPIRSIICASQSQDFTQINELADFFCQFFQLKKHQICQSRENIDPTLLEGIWPSIPSNEETKRALEDFAQRLGIPIELANCGHSFMASEKQYPVHVDMGQNAQCLVASRQLSSPGLQYPNITPNLQDYTQPRQQSGNLGQYLMGTYKNSNQLYSQSPEQIMQGNQGTAINNRFIPQSPADCGPCLSSYPSLQQPLLPQTQQQKGVIFPPGELSQQPLFGSKIQSGSSLFTQQLQGPAQFNAVHQNLPAQQAQKQQQLMGVSQYPQLFNANLAPFQCPQYELGNQIQNRQLSSSGIQCEAPNTAIAVQQNQDKNIGSSDFGTVVMDAKQVEQIQLNPIDIDEIFDIDHLQHNKFNLDNLGSDFKKQEEDESKAKQDEKSLRKTNDLDQGANLTANQPHMFAEFCPDGKVFFQQGLSVYTSHNQKN